MPAVALSRMAAAGGAAGPALAARADLPASLPDRGRGLRVHRRRERPVHRRRAVDQAGWPGRPGPGRRCGDLRRPVHGAGEPGLAGNREKAHYIAVAKKNQPLLHARVRALPWRQVPAGSSTRETGHGRIEARTLKAAHVSRLDFPHARQAIKITRRRQDTGTGRTSRETVYAVTSLTSAHAAAPDLARLVREHWSIEAHHHIRDTTFSEDTSASRTGSGPVNLATIRAAVIAAIKDAGYLHIPEGRRDHTTPAETLRLHGLD